MLSHFTTSLVLVACTALAAEAENNYYGGHQNVNAYTSATRHPNTAQSHSHSTPTNIQQPQYGVPVQGYGQTYAQPVQANAYGATVQHGVAHAGAIGYPQQHQHQQQYAQPINPPQYPAPASPYDGPTYYAQQPFAVSTNDARAGWWSPYQQYSPPQIPYAPMTHTEPVFASCTFDYDVNSTSSSRGVIELAQLPNQPIALSATLNNFASGFSTNGEVSFKVMEYGSTKVWDATNSVYQDCVTNPEILGDEFNPIKELDKYGRQNPYQDPTRGRIDSVTITTADESTATDTQYDYSFGQAHVLQNLYGKESIMGMSIAACQTIAGVETVIQCCPIVQAEAPTSYAPYPSPYPYYHQPAAAHTHVQPQQYQGHTHGHTHTPTTYNGYH